jgi:hypothetical protein
LSVSFITGSSRVKNLGPETDYLDVFHNSPQSLKANARIVKEFLVLCHDCVADVKKVAKGYARPDWYLFLA